MNKKIWLLLILMIFCVTGCKNKLECVYSKDPLKIKINANYKNKKQEAVLYEYSMDFSKENDEFIDLVSEQDFCESIAEESNGLLVLDDCSQRVENKQIIISASINLDASKDDSFKQTKSELKKDLESQGFTCTLKK